MEKLFSILRRPSDKAIVFCAPEGDEIQLKSDQKLSIAKWEEKDTKPWSWELRLVENGKAVVANQLMRGNLDYSSPAMYIGDNGIGIMLGGAKQRANRIDLEVFKLMKKLKVNNLDFRLPTEVSWYANKGMHCVRVFDLKHKEQKPVNDMFTLDPKQPWLLHLTRVVGTNKKEWNSLYVPYGWKPEPEERKAEYAHPEVAEESKQEEKPAAVQEAIPESEEVAEPTIGTPVINAEVAQQLEQRCAEEKVPAEDVTAETESAPETEGVTLQ